LPASGGDDSSPTKQEVSVPPAKTSPTKPVNTRPVLSRPISYNRPGMITHTYDEKGRTLDSPMRARLLAASKKNTGGSSSRESPARDRLKASSSRSNARESPLKDRPRDSSKGSFSRDSPHARDRDRSRDSPMRDRVLTNNTNNKARESPRRERPSTIGRSASSPRERDRERDTGTPSPMKYVRSGSVDSPTSSSIYRQQQGSGRKSSPILDELIEFDDDDDDDEFGDDNDDDDVDFSFDLKKINNKPATDEFNGEDHGLKMDLHNNNNNKPEPIESKKFVNKSDSNGTLDCQRTLTAEFASENCFLPVALLPLHRFRHYWRQNTTPLAEHVGIDTFLQTLKVYLTQEENIHKSEAKLCISSVKNVLEKLDLNGNKQVSVLQLRLFMKPYGVEMSIFDSFLKLRERNGSLLFLAPALPARYIPIRSSVDDDIASATSQPGFTRVIGPAHSGKTVRLLAACHQLPSETDCLWIDFSAEITSEAGAISQLSSELGLGGADNCTVLQLFRKLLSKLSLNSVVVLDQIDSTACAAACSAIFSICAEHHLSFFIVSRTNDSMAAPSIPLVDERDGKTCRSIHVGPLSPKQATQMAAVFSSSHLDNQLLAECAECLPGNILALGTLSPAYFKQIASVSKKNPNSMSSEASHMLMKSLDDAQKNCAHCLAPLLHLNAYTSEECLWYLCEEMFSGNKMQWSEAMHGLERMGWIRASLSTEDFIVIGDCLPPKDNVPTLFKQCAKYCDFWARQLTLLHDAHEAELIPTSIFQFDRYRSHFNRLLDCWDQTGEGERNTCLASFGLLGSNYARDVAIHVAGKVGTLCAIRRPPPECVDICCDIFTIIEHNEKRSVAYLLASLDLARMLLLNNQLFDGLELSTELVTGISDVLPASSQQYHFLLGASQSVLAQVYEGLGQNENAIASYNKSVDSLGACYGLESRQYAIAEHSLGHVHRFINDLKKAELCYKKALERFKTCHGNSADNEDVACVLNDLAGIYKMRDEGDRAFESYLEVLRIRRKVLGEEHIETANSLNNLAVLLHAECKYDDAKRYYQDALVIYKVLLGDLNADVAASLNNLGALYDDLGNFEEARSYYESSLVIRRAVLSEDHPDLAASLGNLAALLDDNGDIAAAKELYVQTLKVTRSIYGNSHVDVASTLVNIAALEDEEGNLAEAKELYEEALAIFIDLYTENHADVASTMTCLANVAKLQHDHPSVRHYFDRVIGIYKVLHGASSAEVSNAMTSYGVYLFKNGTTNLGDDALNRDGITSDDSSPPPLPPSNNDISNEDDNDDVEIKRSTSATVQLYEESSELLEDALRIRREILGPYHADIVSSLKNIGWLRKVQRRFPSAVASYEEALKICEKMYNRNHPEVAECLTQLGVLNKFQNKFKEAISFFEEGIRIYKNVMAEDKKNKKKYSLLMAANFASLAIVHKSMRNYENAVECYTECFEIQFKELGNDNAEVAKTLHALGLVTWYLGNEQTARKMLEEALDIRRRVLPDRHPDILQSLNNLAELLGEDHKFNESMRKYADVIARIEHTLGPNHPDLAIDLLNMALMAYDMGKYNEAIPLFERGLSIRIKAYGDEHELVAEYLLAIANLHVAQRQFRESKFEFEGALSIIEDTLGKQSREYAMGLSQFGKCLQLMCQFKDAIPVINEALLIFRSAVLSADESLKEGERDSRILDLSKILIIGADVFVGLGEYAAAEPYYEEAIEIIQKVLGDDNIEGANTLIKLAEVLKNQQYYDDAKNVYQEALQIRRQCLGVHLDVVQVLNNLGDLCKRLGDFSGALMYYEESLVIREQILGEYHQDVAQSVHAVAAMYDLQGDFVEAERLFQRALVLRRKCLGDMHPDVAQTLNNLAAILDDLNRSDEAEPLYKEALHIYKEVYGDQHPDVALSLNNLAALLDDNGEFDKALQYYEEALVITKKIYGEGSLDVASAQLCLANALKHLKRFSEAENLFQHSLDIKIHHLGEESLDVAATKVLFAELFVDESEIEDAKYLLMEAIRTRENLLGSEHPDVVKLQSRIEQLDKEVSALLETEGEVIHHLDGSKRLSVQTIHSMETAVVRKKEELGADHVAVADLLVQLANSLISRDRYHDALERLQEALLIFRAKYSPDHSLVIVTLDKVISVLSSINECEEALPLLIEVIETKAKVYGETSSSLGESLTELGFIYDRLGNLQKASEVYIKALAIKRLHVGNDSAEVGQALNNLGAIMDDLGDSLGAEPYYREGLEIYKRVYGSHHADVALSLNNLAALLDDRGDYAQAKVYYEEALNITKVVFGEGSIEVASALIAVARTMKSLMQYETAASYYDAAAQIKEVIIGPFTSDVALLYDQVGGMYVKLKWYEMGINVYGKAYSIRQQIFGANHEQLAQSLELIGALHEEWGHPVEAAALLDEALQIRVAHHGSRVSTDVADILVKLAALGTKCGVYIYGDHSASLFPLSLFARLLSFLLPLQSIYYSRYLSIGAGIVSFTLIIISSYVFSNSAKE
jgi:tetratricopeptide (TPR) repeat protein